MIRRSLATVLAALAVVPPAFGGGKGTTAAPFLKVPVNARAVAMAGSFTAVPGDVTGLEYNPAGLAGLRRTDIALTYIDYIEDTSFQAAAVGFPFFLPGREKRPAPTDGVFDTRKLSVALRYNQFKAEDDARNEVGIKQGAITVQDQLFHGGLACSIRPNLALGVGLKSIRSELDSASSSAFAFDAGALWLASNGLRLGASLLNLGGSQNFEHEADPLPALVRVGASKNVRSFLLAADVVQGRDSVTRVSAGADWAIKKEFSLRGGVFHESELGFTAGLGFMFAGPQKAAPAASRRSRKPNGRTPELVFNERRATDLLDRLNFLAAELTERFEGTGRRPSEHQLAVLPASGAGERMGPAISDLLGQQFYQQEAFSVVERPKIEAVLRELKRSANDPLDDAEAAKIGRLLGVKVVAVSQITKSPSNYNMQTRLVGVDSGSALAASSAAFPPDVFSVEMREPLGAVPSPGNSSARAGRMDIGLDYGLTTQGDLGYSHTISLRLLY